MDIKSKKLNSNNNIKKTLIFIITLSLFTGFIASVFALVDGQDGDFGIIFEKDYFHSNDYHREVNSIVGTLESLIVEYRSEENIKEGNLLHGEFSLYNKEKEEMYMEFKEEKQSESDLDYVEINEEDMMLEFERTQKKELEKLKEAIIEEQIKTYNNILKDLEEQEGIIYTASNGKEFFSNTEKNDSEDYKKLPAYILLDRNGLVSEPNQSKNNYLSLGTSILDSSVMNDRYVYIGFKNEFLEPRIAQWELNKTEAMRYPKTIILTFLGTLIGFIILCFLAGRTGEDNKEVKMLKIDRIYTDISLLSAIGIIFIWLGIVSAIFNTGLKEIFEESIFGMNISFLGITFILGGIGLSLLLSLVRHIKNNSFITHSLIYTVFYKLFNFLRRLHRSSSLGKKVILIVIFYPIVVGLTFFIFPITIGLAIWQALKKAKEFETIQEGVIQIKEGDLDYKINIETEGEFRELAENINDIGSGLKNAVDNELRSERHRSELITNVSHDIRTPLTSIITYIDLLKLEKDEEKKKEYIHVLDKKSERLRQLIDDLFEASKVSSGDIPVKLTNINIVSLVEQGLGELNDRVEKHDLEFITNFESDDMIVKADGDLLWRAIENLFSNIFKYSLKGSRVYIDIKEDDKYIYIIMKNISAYKLNISEKELMERFKRGDVSRTSEGSGLGLSITESLIVAQKGKFEIEIDGDLFKTKIKLQKVKKEQ